MHSLVMLSLVPLVCLQGELGQESSLADEATILPLFFQPLVGISTCGSVHVHSKSSGKQPGITHSQNLSLPVFTHLGGFQLSQHNC